LPSSLTRVLPFACRSSRRLPVSVWGTDDVLHRVTAFSCPRRSPTLCPCELGITAINRLPPQSSQRLGYTTGLGGAPHLGTGILTGCPSPTLLSLGLGPTNPTRTDLASEPLDVRRTRFSHVFRYSCQHSHSQPLQRPFQDPFAATGTLPYLDTQVSNPASVAALAPLHSPRTRVRPVSCYALFQGWLLLSQPPGCLDTHTSFPTQAALQDLSRGSGLFPSRRRNSSPAVRLPRSAGGIRSLVGFGKRVAP
jgi:hypothetical protein